jgi:hypothetical protein
MDFDLKTFLKNYQPVSKLDMKPYLKVKKLKGYDMLKMDVLNKQLNTLNKLKGYEALKLDELNKLIETCTYVRYVKEGDAFSDDDLESHVKGGGFFVTGGMYIEGKFEKSDDRCLWTHILLKRQGVPIGKVLTEKGFGEKVVYEYDTKVFTLKLNSNHIFYKYFDPKRRD